MRGTKILTYDDELASLCIMATLMTHIWLIQWEHMASLNQKSKSQVPYTMESLETYSGSFFHQSLLDLHSSYALHCLSHSDKKTSRQVTVALLTALFLSISSRSENYSWK